MSVEGEEGRKREQEKGYGGRRLSGRKEGMRGSLGRRKEERQKGKKGVEERREVTKISRRCQAQSHSSKVKSTQVKDAQPIVTHSIKDKKRSRVIHLLQLVYIYRNEILLNLT